jgi:predicted RNA-binding Zn-ribbon protein involved in translation (DUF1610 family)
MAGAGLSLMQAIVCQSCGWTAHTRKPQDVIQRKACPECGKPALIPKRD